MRENGDVERVVAMRQGGGGGGWGVEEEGGVGVCCGRLGGGLEE